MKEFSWEEINYQLQCKMQKLRSIERNSALPAFKRAIAKQRRDRIAKMCDIILEYENVSDVLAGE